MEKPQDPVLLYSPDGTQTRQIPLVDAGGWISVGWSKAPKPDELPNLPPPEEQPPLGEQALPGESKTEEQPPLGELKTDGKLKSKGTTETPKE
jgi:hypothetical protein